MIDPRDYDAEYNGGQLVVTCVILLALTYFSVGLRVLVRAWIMKSFQWDDWFMLCAQAVFTLSCSFILAGVHWGLGHHNMDLDVEPRIEALKYQTLATLSYVINMMFIKISIAIFLLRIATKRRYTWTLKISMVIVTIWSLATFLFDTFQCTPVAAQWDFTITDGKCAPGDDFVAAAYAISVMTVLTDWMYAIIPIPMIWTVQMSPQKKFTVAFVLSLGVFASIATLIRVKYLVELASYADILFTGTTAMVWTLVEPGIAITAASLITIRPLLRAMHFKGFGSTDSGTSRGLTSGNMSRSRRNPNVSQRRDDFQMANWSTLSTAVGRGEENSKISKGVTKSRTETVSDAGSEVHILGDEEAGVGENANKGDGMAMEDGIRTTRTVTVVIQQPPTSRIAGQSQQR